MPSQLVWQPCDCPAAARPASSVARYASRPRSLPFDASSSGAPPPASARAGSADRRGQRWPPPRSRDTAVPPTTSDESTSACREEERRARKYLLENIGGDAQNLRVDALKNRGACAILSHM